MLKRGFVTAIVVALSVVHLSAELKYTMRMQLKPASAPAGAGNEALAAIGAQVIEMMVPGGSADMTVLTGDRGTRVEANKARVGMPLGSVMLQRPDGSIVVLVPAARTYWKVGAADMGAIKATTKRTGEYSTISGERVERVTFRFEVPIGADATSAGVPPIAIEGDAWIAEKYRRYTAVTAKTAPGLGLAELAQMGLSIRQVMRSPIFGDKEIESVVTRIVEEAAPAALFQVPADYKEVPAPGRSGG